MLHPRPQVHHLPVWAGEKPSGIRPSRCQCFTLALRFTTCPYGPARSPLAFVLARKEAGVCIPDPLAFEDGQLRRWKPFGLAREEVAGRRLLAAGSHTVFILYGARPTVVGCGYGLYSAIDLPMVPVAVCSQTLDRDLIGGPCGDH